MITGNEKDMFGRSIVTQTLVNHHNAHVTNTKTQMAALNKAIADQSAKMQTIEGKQTATETALEAQKTAQANTEAALQTKVDALTNQLEAANIRFDTQKSESETKIHQLETKLQNLSLSYLEILEQLTQLTSRFNESNSFFGSSRAPTEVGDDDSQDLNK